MKFWNKSLMTRLVGSFLLLSVVTLVIAGYLAFIGAEEALKQSVIDRFSLLAAHKEDHLSEWMESQRREVEFLASLPEVQTIAVRLLDENNPDFKDAHGHMRWFLKSILAVKPDLQEVFILADRGGKIILSTNKSHEGEYRVTDSFFKEGRLGTYIQTAYPSPIEFKPTLTISTPLMGRDGQRSGVLAAHLNLEQMDRSINERTGLGVSGEIYLVDKYNMFISSDRFGRDRYPRGVHSAGLDAAVQGLDGDGLYLNYDGIQVIGVYRWIEDLELALLVEITRTEAYAPARQIGMLIVVIGMVVIGLLSIVIILIAQQIARPILGITDAAIQVADGDLGAKAPVMTQDELGILAQTFNTMTGRLRNVLDNLRQEVAERERAEKEVFALNSELEQRVHERTRDLEAASRELESFSYTMSHDLRTPLRGINGFSLALLEDYGDRLDDQGKDYLYRVRASTKRMGQLIEDILELFRVSRSEMIRDYINLSDLAEAIARDLKAVEPERQAVFEITPALTVQGDERLLRIALENLLGNAWKYTSKQPVSRIEFERTAQNGKSVFYIRDNGVGFDMTYVDKIFKPFQRLHTDKEFEGTGIGLATVQRIIHRHGGDVWAKSAVGKGATIFFTLQTE